MSTLDPITFAPPPEAPSTIIKVSAFFKRFDTCCNPPKRFALTSDPDNRVRGLVTMAMANDEDGIDLASQSLADLLGVLVGLGKISQADADTIRTTPPAPNELKRL